LAEIEDIISREGFWDNPEETKDILIERTFLSDQIDGFKKLKNDLEESDILLDLALEESNAEAIEEVGRQVEDINDRISKLSLDLMLSGKEDRNNAIISINAGAGGTEAQDWAEMLFRMYLRWCERKDYKTDIIDFQPGDEAGIKSVTFTATGEFAYGFLKSEQGVHRLVRLSPFDADHARHTSFALVEVLPEAEEQADFTIPTEELRVDTFRSSGPGGQHMQKTSSAVRITHIPTGIVATCQSQRSQHQNRDVALKIVYARLLEMEREKKQREQDRLKGDRVDAGWGNQIRSYVLHPYKMVKDHRTGYETSAAEAVLDGSLDEFINAYLRSLVGES